METLALVLAYLGMFIAGMIARSALVALVLTVAGAPVVAIVTGMRALEERLARCGGGTLVHGLPRRAL